MSRIKHGIIEELGLPDEIRGQVRSSILSILKGDSYPRSATWPEMGLPPEVWRVSPGPLANLRNGMYNRLKPIRTKDEQLIEKQYFQDYLPRNVRESALIREKLSRITPIVPRPLEFDFPDIPTIMYIMMLLGLGKRKYEPSGIGAIDPANGQASVGLTYDSINDIWFLGHKSQYWPLVQQSAYARLEQLPNLHWSDSPAKWQALMIQHKCYFIPWVRIDTGRGFLSPRVIWCGDGIRYILETDLFTCLRKDLHESLIVPHHVNTIVQRFEDTFAYPGTYLSFDYSGWDITQYGEAMKRVWQAVATLYEMPLQLACYCAAYNLCAPLIIADQNVDDIMAYYRWGNQPSGSGAFVWINHILHMIYMVWSLHCILGWSIDKATLHVGQVYGDDGWVKAPVDASQWSLHSQLAYGLVMKPKQTVQSKTSIVFLRKLLSQESPEVQPVVMSRWRNALCPSMNDPAHVPKELKAIIARAQFMEIAHAAIRGKYSHIIKYWTSVVRAETYMYPIPDAELVLSLPLWAREYVSSLNHIKGWYGISDSIDILG